VGDNSDYRQALHADPRNVVYEQRLAALHDGWQASVVPDKTGAMIQKPIHDSAIDSVKPAAIKAAREVRTVSDPCASSGTCFMVSVMTRVSAAI